MYTNVCKEAAAAAAQSILKVGHSRACFFDIFYHKEAPAAQHTLEVGLRRGKIAERRLLVCARVQRARPPTADLEVCSFPANPLPLVVSY